MKEGAITVFKDYVGLCLLAIGITVPMHQFFGGLFLAVAGASFASKFWPEGNERELWVVVFGALLAAVFTAAAVQWMGFSFPIPLAMGLAGFFSRYLARMMLRAAGLMENNTDRIVKGALDRVLPDDKPDDRGGGK